MKRMRMLTPGLLGCVALVALAAQAGRAGAETIGSVDTEWKMIGKNHRIEIQAFDDPEVPGVACHVSRAVTGGISGSVGLAEDTADASISCRQIGPIDVAAVRKLKNGQDAFKVSTSLLFKKLHVTRFFDAKRNVIVYLAYSDKLIDGSPKNAISSVPIQVWTPVGN